MIGHVNGSKPDTVAPMETIRLTAYSHGAG